MQFTEPGSVGWKENPFTTESGEEGNGIFSQVSIETEYGVQEEQEEVEEPFGANLYDSQEEGATEEKGKTGGKERECTPEIILEDTQKEGEVKNARGFTIDERYNKPDEWGSSIDENDSNDRTGDTDGFRYYNVHGDATTSSKRALDNSGEHEDLLKEEEAGEGYEVRITVTEPRKEGDGTVKGYMTYLVTTAKLDIEGQVKEKIKRRRRYQDFAWLHSSLVKEHSSVAVPPLAKSSGVEYISGDRFGVDFVNKRKHMLERFLIRVSMHPKLRSSKAFTTFTEAKDWSSQYESNKKQQQQQQTNQQQQQQQQQEGSELLEGLSDTIVNTFSKVKQREQKYEDMKLSVGKTQDYISKAQKLVTKVTKTQNEIEKLYDELGKGYNELAEIETGLYQILSKTSVSINENAKLLRKLSDRIQIEFGMDLEELHLYCEAFKQLLKLRDQKQIVYEDLIVYKEKTSTELNRLLNYQSATGVSMFTNYVRGKIRDIQGIDPAVSRQTRINGLNSRLKELDNAVDMALEEKNEFSTCVENEYAIFQHIKQSDLTRCLKALSKSYISYLEKSNEFWSQILPDLYCMN